MLVAAHAAWQAARAAEAFRKALAAAVELDGVTIVEGDPRRESGQRRRPLDERRAAIGSELHRRDLRRREVIR